MNKKLCPIHHFYYNGVECPLCFEERIKRMENKYVHTTQKQKEEKSEEITDDLLKKLKEKFSA